MTVPASKVAPITAPAATISQRLVVRPKTTIGVQPSPHSRSITVRYRRGSRSDATTREPTAPPTPKAARTKACCVGPPPASLMANGTSTSSGPTTASTISDANSSVASSQGVATM